MTRSAKAEDLVKKGDELDLIVTKVNDQEGVVYLSKKRLDENKGREAVAAAVESGEILEGLRHRGQLRRRCGAGE